MVIYCRGAGVLSVIYQWGSVYFRIPRAELFISGDPFISGFPGPFQMIVGVCSETDGDDDGVSFFRLFRNPWVRFVVSQTSDGCDQSRDPRIIARARRTVPLHSTRPHRYFTRRNTPRLMDPPNADILELKEKMGELINVMQEFALGQKVIAEKVGRIEDWLKMGNMQGNASSSGPKKPFGNDQHKDEGESSAVYAQRGHGRGRYYQHTAAVTIPADNQPAQQQQQRQPFQQRSQRVGYPVRRRMSDRHFDRPPVIYSFLLKKLKDMGLVQLRTLAPMGLDQRPANFDENVKCEFHSGAPGHSVEDCKAFKHVVQDLVDSKAINFASSPNVNANPMPAHGQAMVNAITEDSDRVCAMGEETDSDWEIDQWIKPCADEEGEEDCDLLELARLSKQEEKVIQPHAERIEVVIPSTAENGSLVEGAGGRIHLVMSGYAKVEYRCRCAQAPIERRLSSREAKRQCLYQRAMVTLFHDMIHHEIECYDMIAKSQTEEGHLVDLAKLVNWLRQFKLRLNSDECTIRVRSGVRFSSSAGRLGIQDDGAEKVQTSPGILKSGKLMRGWKVDTVIRRVDGCSVPTFLISSARSPSRVIGLAPQQIRGPGWLSSAGGRVMHPQLSREIAVFPSGVSVSISPVKVLVVPIPSSFPSGLGAKEALPQQGLLFPSSSVIPQQGGIGAVTSSSAECLVLPRRCDTGGSFSVGQRWKGYAISAIQAVVTAWDLVLPDSEDDTPRSSAL
ncbi:hypothetical protein KIW84_021082 [Lathyrus oleraceus]|uniref:Uncharacterized protein n=1 Tax=Pisum sativum TaxID=3888 RepID=A0A9D4Y839_PEA|nr:hypothetical protein KIW84_021082 [Pisum sativum]